MGLPKISHPTFNVVIPSTKAKVRMRPFLVREEKILLLAQTSEDPTDISEAIKQVINNCAIDTVDVDQFTTFDLEYTFLKLRARSVGNIIELKYTDPIDENVYDIAVNLDDVEIINDPAHTTKVEFTKTSGLMLRYPKADMAGDLKNIQTEVDLLFSIVKYCIEKVYDEEDVYNIADFSEEEVDDFVNELTVDTFQKIQKFFETMPRLHYEAKYKTKSGEERSVVLKTLTDFFTLR
jgi:hypothetical protein